MLDSLDVVNKDDIIEWIYSLQVLPTEDNYLNGGCSESSIGWSTGPPMEEPEKVAKELKGSATL